MLNKTIRLKRLNITILLLLLGGCTSTLNDDSLTIEKDLSLNEAREIYEKHNALIATKSQVSPNNFFQRNVAGLLWDKAKSSSNEKTSCVDIPILSDYIYGAFLKDAKGKMYISKCYHSITVLKTKKTTNFTYTTISISLKNHWHMKTKANTMIIYTEITQTMKKRLGSQV